MPAIVVPREYETLQQDLSGASVREAGFLRSARKKGLEIAGKAALVIALGLMPLGCGKSTPKAEITPPAAPTQLAPSAPSRSSDKLERMNKTSIERVQKEREKELKRIRDDAFKPHLQAKKRMP